MSREWKIVIVVGAVVLCLCSIACISMAIISRYAVSKTIASEPEQAARIGHEIVDYTLPPGYAEVFGLSVFSMKWVIIARDGPDTLVIMLMQMPADSDMSQEEMQREMERSMAQQSQYGFSNLEKVGTQKVTIRGEEVVLTVSEGRSEDEEPMRQVVGVFPGKGNTIVMLMAMGKVETWDQATLDAFLISIR